MVIKLSISPLKMRTDEPDKCHNRWRPEIKPALEVDPGDIVEIETRDALDGQVASSPGFDDVSEADLSLVHPLTVPVYVKGTKLSNLLGKSLRYCC